MEYLFGETKKKCPKGKVINPKTGRCVNKNSPVLKKSVSPRRKSLLPKKKPKKEINYSRKSIKSPYIKPVKNKKDKKIGNRLSARAIYNEHGNEYIGKEFDILQPDGNYKQKFLRLRSNGSPYFSNKFGSHLTFPLVNNRRGPIYSDMTGYKNSWPDNLFIIPPSGVRRPTRFGKTCFG